MRFFVEISYDGTDYHGWQSQKNAISLQEVITDKLSTLLNTHTEIMGSGRTDAGVHARKQVFHFDCIELDTENLKYRLNSFLPKDIAVNAIKRVKEDAHARFDATLRGYKYIISTIKDPFMSEYAWKMSEELNLNEMQKASDLLIGHQDFESFSRVKTDVNHFNCNIKSADWSTKGHFIEFNITADRFLRGMVRTIVGTIVNVGLGKWDADHIKKVISARDRATAGSAAPAKGLYLTLVNYPENIFL